MMLFFKRIKYRKDLKSYCKIVTGLSDILTQIIKDASSPTEFLNYDESAMVLFVSELVDAVKLISLYSMNRLSKPTTICCLNNFKAITDVYDNLINTKCAFSDACFKKHLTEEAMSVVSDEVELARLKQSYIQINKIIDKNILKAKKLHFEMIRIVSSVRSALRNEFLAVCMEKDIIAEFYGMTKVSDEIQLTITKLEKANESGENK